MLYVIQLSRKQQHGRSAVACGSWSRGALCTLLQGNIIGIGLLQGVKASNRYRDVYFQRLP